MYTHLHIDMLLSPKSDDSPASNGSSADYCSNSPSSVAPIDKKLRDEEPKIFSKLQPDQLRLKGVVM